MGMSLNARGGDRQGSGRLLISLRLVPPKDKPDGSFLKPTSHESVRKRYRRLGRGLPPAQRRRRSIVAMDETKIKIRGIQFYIWAATDVHSREVFSLGVSSGRSDLEAMAFVRKVLSLSAWETIFLVDRGPWYEKAFRKLGVKFQRMTHGLRNSTEQWFGLLKARTDRFRYSFPHRSSIDSTRSWINAFRNLYQLDNTVVSLEEV